MSDQVTTAGGSWHSQQLGHPDFGLRQRLRNENEEKNENLELQAAEHFFTENYPKLTDEQRIISDEIKQKADESAGGFYFIDAFGGTGKTFTLNVIIDGIRKDGNIAIVTAASGIAATILHNGFTAHSKLKIPIPIYNDSVCNIGKRSALYTEVRDAKIIIIDEISMLHRHAFEAIDRTLKVMTNNANEPFGGKLVVVSGDFCQILPVIPKGSRATIVGATIKASTLWEHVHIIHLKICGLK